MKRIDRSEKVRVGFHQAKWDEPIIYELSTPGERGILVPKASAQVAQEVGDGFSSIPAGMAGALRSICRRWPRTGYCATTPVWPSRPWAPM